MCFELDENATAVAGTIGLTYDATAVLPTSDGLGRPVRIRIYGGVEVIMTDIQRHRITSPTTMLAAAALAENGEVRIDVGDWSDQDVIALVLDQL